MNWALEYSGVSNGRWYGFYSAHEGDDTPIEKRCADGKCTYYYGDEEFETEQELEDAING